MNNPETKKKLKNKKPSFIRQRPHKIKLKNKLKWRRAKGLHSKTRLKHKGNTRMPKPGYGSPKILKNLNQNGLKEVIIKTIKDLDNINTKTQAAILSRTLGNKKRIEIAKKAKELKIEIQNLKDLDSFVKEIEEEQKRKKVKVQERRQQKEKSKKVKEEKKAEKETEDTKKEQTKEAIKRIEEKPEEKKVFQQTHQKKQAPIRKIPQGKK